MKKVLLFLLMLSLFPLANAQETKEMKIVGKPKKLDSGEMVARQDQNGNYCSAIQVVSDMDGFSYDSNDGIVGDIQDNPGRDIVFLTPTERVLDVFKSGYKPLKIILSDVGITLKTREVWQIEIAGEELADVLPVTFRSTPADATLLIDGKPAGTSATQNLALGKHTIKIVKDSYQTIEKDITVDDKNVFFEYKMVKQPDAALQIETIPEGATVYLEGVKLGESPVAAFYKPGTYPIRITKEGYVSFENQNLEVTLPQTRKSFTLEENVGYLTVNTNAGATVYFNDKIISNPKNVKLTPQLVKVKVTMPKAETLEQQVALKRNDKLVLEMYPDVQTGSLQIAVTPFDAKIELTGDAGEKYFAEGMKIFEEIPVGSFTVKVSAREFKTAERIVTLKKDEILNLSFNLESGSDAFVCGQNKIFDKRDENEYETIQIGKQCWMKENLNIGTLIFGNKNQTDNGRIEKYCYDNSESNCNVYGGLYQWDEMMQYSTFPKVQGICPDKWHIPNVSEWTIMTDYLGGLSFAGGKMKEAGTSHWRSTSSLSTNDSNFTALPAGERLNVTTFYNITKGAFFWTSDQSATSSANRRWLYLDTDSVNTGAWSKSIGYSVRCIMDY